MNIKKCAFTMAEVLITLGIIGIVAAMTLPSLLASYNEKVAVVRLKHTYSIFAQAYLRAVAAEGPADGWDINPADNSEGGNKLYGKFKPYLVKVNDCGKKSGCFYEGTYKALNSSAFAWQPATHGYARGVLANGVSFAFWSGGSGCNADFSKNGKGVYRHTCGTIYVDINSYKNPNQAGVDYFKFVVTKDGVFPAGTTDYKDANGAICKYKDTSKYNGVTCTGWVLNKENMDYLRRDISNEWK